jgi:hypothetical protein
MMTDSPSQGYKHVFNWQWNNNNKQIFLVKPLLVIMQKLRPKLEKWIIYIPWLHLSFGDVQIITSHIVTK